MLIYSTYTEVKVFCNVKYPQVSELISLVIARRDEDAVSSLSLRGSLKVAFTFYPQSLIIGRAHFIFFCLCEVSFTQNN